jgi:hypothetical protein
MFFASRADVTIALFRFGSNDAGVVLKSFFNCRIACGGNPQIIRHSRSIGSDHWDHKYGELWTSDGKDMPDDGNGDNDSGNNDDDGNNNDWAINSPDHAAAAAANNDNDEGMPRKILVTAMLFRKTDAANADIPEGGASNGPTTMLTQYLSLTF